MNNVTLYDMNGMAMGQVVLPYYPNYGQEPVLRVGDHTFAWSQHNSRFEARAVIVVPRSAFMGDMGHE